MAAVKDLGPLDWRTPIVDGGGRPSPQFQRLWNTQRDNNALIGTVTFGVGAPTGTPNNGALYMDTTKLPWVLYVGDNSAWNIVGVQDFTQLADVPGNYTGAANDLVHVNGNATGLVFGSLSSVLDGITVTEGSLLVRGNATWGSLAPGNATQVLTANGAGALPSWQAGGGGGGGGTAPTIRGSGIQASSAASYVVPWPTGTVAGDLAIIHIGGGFGISATPTGWTLLDNQQGSNWNGAMFGKVLSSADITAGSVTITNAGTFDSVVSIITFHGATGGAFGLFSLRNSGGASTEGISTAAFASGAIGVYFGSNRGASTDTVNQGTKLQQINDGSNASGCLYAGAPTAPFVGSAIFSYSSVGSGNYQSILLVIGP